MAVVVVASQAVLVVVAGVLLRLLFPIGALAFGVLVVVTLVSALVVVILGPLVRVAVLVVAVLVSLVGIVAGTWLVRGLVACAVAGIIYFLIAVFATFLALLVVLGRGDDGADAWSLGFFLRFHVFKISFLALRGIAVTVRDAC